MRISHVILASAAALASIGSTVGKAAKAPEVNSAAVPAPKNGDWSIIVAKTPEGGFMMGNPDAKVKLVEFGSMSCDHCANFEQQAGKALVDDYVKRGLVSWEFRNYVRDPFDMTAALLARCSGEANFFGLTRALFLRQKDWIDRIQRADQAQMQALQAMPAAQQFSTIADLAGFKAIAAQGGVPLAKAEQCLSNEADLNQLVQMNSDAISNYSIPGTPSFLINGGLIDDVHTWEALEPRIKEALAN